MKGGRVVGQRFWQAKGRGRGAGRGGDYCRGKVRLVMPCLEDSQAKRVSRTVTGQGPQVRWMAM